MPAEEDNALDEPIAATVESLGSKGDGIAYIGGEKLHVPFALPGDTVAFQKRGQRTEFVELIKASPHRIPAICRHFGACGGCVAQHIDRSYYLDWKRSLVLSQLARVQIETPAPAIQEYALATRRRAAFHAKKLGAEVRLGFKASGSHEIIDIEECPILHPKISATLPIIRQALSRYQPPGIELEIQLTAAANGLDCAMSGAGMSVKQRGSLAESLAGNFIRYSWNGESFFGHGSPFVNFAGVPVPLPPNSFLQAVEDCENDMASFIVNAIRKTNKKGVVCDLFSGLGAFTFPCAKERSVTAYEGSSASVDALNSGFRKAQKLKPVQAIRRDLFRNPLSLIELNKFAAIILDPPREGAEAQCKAIAASKAPIAVSISCNPATFARDAATLASGGFQLSDLTLFDQFKFSAHIEIGAVFKR